LLLLLLPVACWPWQVFRNECRPGQNRNEIIAVRSLALIEGEIPVPLSIMGVGSLLLLLLQQLKQRQK